MTTVVDPHVKTDTSIDFRTVEGILGSLIEEGMTDEEKVLKIFHTIRRMFVHGPTPRILAYDFHKVMHVLGTGACLSMTTPLHMLYDRLGYKSQSWVHDGHHMMQVYYDDAWHCFDPHMDFYCYDRSTPPQIASIQQLQDDPTLARNAVEEGRAGQGYLLCGDAPDWFAGKEGDWYLEADGEWPEMKIEEPFGGITLRRGERYIRTWHPGEYFYKAGWIPRDGTGPIHHCGEADRKDAANWYLYEPHAWTERPGHNRTYYRVWGTGRLVYRPPLDTMLDGDNLNITRQDGRILLTQADTARPAEIVLSVSCPYVLTAGELRCSIGSSGKIDAWIKVNDVAARSDEDWDHTLAYDYTPIPLTAENGRRTARFIDEINGCFDGYLLKLRLSNGATLRDIELVSHFQLNRYSLPHLASGKNVISVEASRFNAPLVVRYDWSEGSDWTQPRSAQHTFTADGTFEIEVVGPKYPRMEALILEVPV